MYYNFVLNQGFNKIIVFLKRRHISYLNRLIFPRGVDFKSIKLESHAHGASGISLIPTYIGLVITGNFSFSSNQVIL